MSAEHRIKMGYLSQYHAQQIVEYSVLFLGTFISEDIRAKYEIDEHNDTTIVIDFAEELNYTSYKLQFTDTAFMSGISEMIINDNTERGD